LVLVDGKVRRYRGTIPRLGVGSLLDVGQAQWRLERMARQVPLDAPWTARHAARWDATTLGAWLARNLRTTVARDLLTAGLESVFAAELGQLSLLHALFYIHSGRDLDTLFGTTDGAQATRVDGGMQGVAERLGAGLDVRLGCAARRIEHGHAVTVHHDRGAVTADRAIIAIPPHLIAAIDFTPRLPPERAALIAHADGRGDQVHRDLRPAVLARRRAVGAVAVRPRADPRRLRQLAARRPLRRADGLRRGRRRAPAGRARRGWPPRRRGGVLRPGLRRRRRDAARLRRSRLGAGPVVRRLLRRVLPARRVDHRRPA
jgi:hypothetical protein